MACCRKTAITDRGYKRPGKEAVCLLDETAGSEAVGRKPA